MLKGNEYAGENIGGYRITIEIASSPLSRTFLGTSLTEPQQSVFIKWFYTERINSQEEQDYILQRIQDIQQLHHPHIFPIQSAGIHKEAPYVIAECAPKGSLQERIRNISRKPMKTKEALDILGQIGQALAYAHQQHITHGNIHARNILFDAQDNALLADFRIDLHGSASEQGPRHQSVPSTKLRVYCYTVGEDEQREKSDQYALGCLAYELFTGQRPFIMPSVNKPGKYYRTRTLIAPRRLNPSLLPEIEEAILKALSKEPSQSFSDIPAFLAALGLSTSTEAQEVISPLVLSAVDQPSGVPVSLSSCETESMLSYQQQPRVPLRLPRLSLGVQSIARAALRSRARGGPSFKREWLLMTIIGLMIIGFLTTLSFGVLSPRATKQFRRTTTPAYVVASPSTGKVAALPGSTPTPTPSTAAMTTRVVQPAQPTATATPAPTHPVNTTFVPVPLDSYYNSAGVADRPGDADFDGSGYSYPAYLMPESGQRTLGGVPYLFPFTNSNDNIVALGQTITVPQNNYSQVYLLMAASYGPTSGTVTLHYTDGTSSSVSVTVPDWYDGPSGVVNLPYRFSPYSRSSGPIHIYTIQVPADSARMVTSLSLPTTTQPRPHQASIHLFSLTLI